jgi:peroxiredoxin
MFSRTVVAAFVLLCCLAAPGRAQTVDEIVDKFVAATGGADKWKSLQTLAVASRSPQFSFDLYWKKPNRVRVDVPVEATEPGGEPGVDIRGCDGKAGWRFSPLEGAEKPRLMAAAEVLDLLEMGDAQRELVDYRAKGYKVELLGREPVGDSPAYKLKLTKPSGAVVNIFIDAKSFLEVKRVIYAKAPGGGESRELVILVGDYRPVGGLLLPRRVGGATREYRVNEPIEDAVFRMPATGGEDARDAGEGAEAKEGDDEGARVRDPARRAQLLKEHPEADVNKDGVLSEEEALAFIKRDNAARALLRAGDAAPDWTLSDARGGSHSLSDYRGKVVVMDFWAVWCVQCHRAMPWLQKLHADLSERGVEVIGVSTDEKGGDPVQLMKDRGYTYGLMLHGETISKAYGVVGMPAFYVVGTDGRVVYSGFGTTPALEAQRRAIIEDYLKQKRM